MPLRDHFHKPKRLKWDSVHATLPVVLALKLNEQLPERFVAGPGVHRALGIEIDVATFETDDEESLSVPEEGGVAAAVYAPTKPTLSVRIDQFDQDAYEVEIIDQAMGLVAAIEIVSPANKDRADSRAAFVAKCSTLLRRNVSVTVLDYVTDRKANLYFELLESIDCPIVDRKPYPLYAVACRTIRRRKKNRLEAWEYPLTVGQPLPTLPIWLTEDLCVPLELEAAYEETCKGLKIA